MSTKLFLKPFCARYTEYNEADQQFETVRFYHWGVKLRLIWQFPSYIKVELPPQVKTRGCLLAVVKEKPAEVAITPALAITSD